MQEIKLDMHIGEKIAKDPAALWEALAMLKRLSTVAISDHFGKNRDSHRVRGFAFPSISLISHIR